MTNETISVPLSYQFSSRAREGLGRGGGHQTPPPNTLPSFIEQERTCLQFTALQILLDTLIRDSPHLAMQPMKSRGVDVFFFQV